MTDHATPETPTGGQPFPCPGCGRTDAWRADYFEAVAQKAEVVTGDDGEPEVFEYTGDETSYSEGATTDESLRCAGCGYIVELGSHVFVPAGTPPFAEIAGMLARTALTDPAQVDERELAEHVEAAETLDATFGEAAPSPLTLYAVDQLDQASGALRRIYEPEEVAAES